MEARKRRNKSESVSSMEPLPDSKLSRSSRVITRSTGGKGNKQTQQDESGGSDQKRAKKEGTKQMNRQEYTLNGKHQVCDAFACATLSFFVC